MYSMTYVPTFTPETTPMYVNIYQRPVTNGVIYGQPLRGYH